MMSFVFSFFFFYLLLQRAPREFRSLFHPSERLPKGKLEMWVEVHTEHKFGDAQVKWCCYPLALYWTLDIGDAFLYMVMF